MAGGMVLLCGRSFSGKSTVASSLAAALPAAVVSLDAINEERGLRGGEGVPVAEWARTNEVARARVRTSLAAGGTVVVDDTSSPRFLRDGWRVEAEVARAAMVLVFVDAAEDLIRERLRQNRSSRRRSDVTDEVMAEHLASFEPPDEDEHPIRLAVGTGPADLDGLAAEVRRALGRYR